MITTFCVDTVMGTVAIIFKTFICDNKHLNVTQLFYKYVART